MIRQERPAVSALGQKLLSGDNSRRPRGKSPKAWTQGQQSGHESEASLRLHPREPTQRHALCRGHERSCAPCLVTPIQCRRRYYSVDRVVFVEFHETITNAIFRETPIEKWPRA
jgi:hypothetical protein